MAAFMLGEALGGKEECLDRIFDGLVYVTRYGHQPFTEVRNWTRRRLTRYTAALNRLLETEQESGNFSGRM